MIRLMRASSFLILVAALLALGAVPAHAAVKSALVAKQVPATFEYKTAERLPSKSCVNAIFVQWMHVPNAIHAKAKYRWRSGGHAANGGPFSDRETAINRDNDGRDYRFDNKWPGDQIFQAEPGVDWMQLPYNYSTGGYAACPGLWELLPKTVEGTPQLELTLRVTAPRAASNKGTQTLPKKTRRATIGTVTCPKHGECKVTAPKTVKVRIGGKKGKTYTLSVKAPKKLVAKGKAKKGNVTVTFPKAAAAALKGTKVRPSVKVTVRNNGVLKTTKSLKRWVRR